MDKIAIPFKQPVSLGDPAVDAFVERLIHAIWVMDLSPVQPELEALRIRVDGIQWNPDPANLHPPELRRLWHFWRDQHRDANPTLLESLDLKAVLPPEISDYCMLLEPSQPAGTDFRYRYYGVGIAHAAGQDWSGRCISEMVRIGNSGLFYLATYRAAAHLNLPIVTININAPRLNTTFWSRLILPWRESNGISGFLVGNVPSETPFQAQSAYPDIYRQENTYLHSLLAESPLGVAIAVGRDAFVFCNNALAELLGTTADELIRLRPEVLFPETRIFHQQLDELYQGAAVDGIECQLRTVSGDSRWVMLSYRRILFTGLDAVLIWVVDISQRRQLEANLRQLATTDDLTGIANRRYFMERANQELQNSRRYGYLCAVAVVDVDHFKAVNDQLGHASGDLALQFLARMMERNLRQGDILGRLGGEEFGLLLSHTDPDTAGEVLERMRQRVQNTPVETPTGPLSITISIGMIIANDDNSPLDQLLIRADEALYRAKTSGRNRVCMATTALP